MDTIAEGADHNKIIATISVDQSTTFDCVEHELLIDKLSYYGLTDHMIKWITSYLQHRLFYVVVGSAVSGIKSTPHGVPQGSIMGPLLYLLYVNDFPSIIEDDTCDNPYHSYNEKLFGNECKKCGLLPVYMDDGTYLLRGRHRAAIQDIIEIMFTRIKNYLNAHRLKINEAKTGLTEFMVCQKREHLQGIPPELMVA